MAHQTVTHDGVLAACTGTDAEPAAGCPVEVALRVLRGRWMPLVLLQFLHHGRRDFTELSAALPKLSAKVLSERLGQLTDAGVLTRHRTAAWPPRVGYTLTDRGRALLPILQALWQWGSESGDPA